MRTAISTIAIIAMTGAANAACNVSGNIVAFTVTGQLNESDCASAATVASQGVSIANLQASDAAQNTAIAGLQGTVGGHTSQINALQTSDANQNAAIIFNYVWDGVQQTQIGALQSGHVAQQGQINTLQSGKVDKTRLDNFGPSNAAPAGSLERWAGGVDGALTTHNGQIAALESLAATQGAQINANTALLSQHTAKLEDHSKGLAIAMAMPDAWLSDKKRFGVFGAIGGLDGETAMDFAAIGRIDETFSLNAKLGADMDFDQFGWQVGVGAQW
jgi:hypothetical protein